MEALLNFLLNVSGGVALLSGVLFVFSVLASRMHERLGTPPEALREDPIFRGDRAAMLVRWHPWLRSSLAASAVVFVVAVAALAVVEG